MLIRAIEANFAMVSHYLDNVNIKNSSEMIKKLFNMVRFN